MRFTKNISILFTVAYCLTRPAFSQKPATVREYEKTFKTYCFYDPNPIPSFSQYYPYFRFDGFEHERKDKKWKIVELENDYIRVRITPEIGGKIWPAYDKVNGKDFIYENDVVKFRDIAMRGAWTSGGLEINFGILGHTPTVSTPVDYLAVERENGSVSCVISSFDLISRTYWLVDIHLPRDKVLFTTKVYWNNPTQFEKPYYQ